MNASLTSVGAITLFVDDPKRSKAFYERVFDVPVVFEDAESAAFKFDNLIVNLLAAGAAPELIEPAAVAGRDVGSRFELTIGSTTPTQRSRSSPRAASRCSTGR